MAQEDYYYEIQLTNKQLVFYFVAGATGLILSFLAGVMVGRGVDNQGGEVQAARPAVEERTVSEETVRPSTPVPASPGDLTYAQRLESDKANDSLDKPRPAGATSPAPAPSAEVGGAALKAPPPVPSPVVSPRTAKVTASPTPKPVASAPKADEAAIPAPRPTPKPATKEVKPAAPAKAAAPGTFTIQVGAFKDKGSADTVVSHLKEKGFAAFVVPPDGDDGLFLVRVGAFAARADAERTETKLRDQEKFKPYIVKN